MKRVIASVYKMEYLLVMLVALEVADAVISYYLIKGGLGREGNPLMGGLVGDGKFVILKALGGVLCAFLLWDIYKRWPKLAVVSTSCLLVGLAAIVVWNVYAWSITAG